MKIDRIFSYVLLILVILLANFTWSIAVAMPSHSSTGVIRFVKPTGTGNCSSWINPCSLQTAWRESSLTNVIFSDNEAFFDGDGGMYNWFSDLLLTNVSFSGNYVGYFRIDGGMANEYYSSPQLANVTFYGSRASFGGVVYNNKNSTPTLNDVSFLNHSGPGGGGEMSNASSNPILLGVPFSDDLPNSLYLPLIMKSIELIEPIECNPNIPEQQIADLLLKDSGQQHPSLTCNRILEQVAGERAQDMADRHYFSHVNPDGFGPNFLVELAGYVLPDWYGDDPQANNIESIAGGYSTATSVWAAWMNSDGHRTHLLGEIDFFRNQTEYGIGYYYSNSSDYGHYWVVIIAQPGP